MVTGPLPGHRRSRSKTRCCSAEGPFASVIVADEVPSSNSIELGLEANWSGRQPNGACRCCRRRPGWSPGIGEELSISRTSTSSLRWFPRRRDSRSLRIAFSRFLTTWKPSPRLIQSAMLNREHPSLVSPAQCDGSGQFRASLPRPSSKSVTDWSSIRTHRCELSTVACIQSTVIGKLPYLARAIISKGLDRFPS